MSVSENGLETTALEALLALINDYHDFNPGQVQIATDLPTPIEFSKQVSKGIPCVYPAAKLLSKYPALKWSRERLCEVVGEAVEVAFTPDGRADSLCVLPGSSGTEKVFLQPANVNMTMRELFSRLDAPHTKKDLVCYLQSQNSNLTNTPLQVLLQDLPDNFTFAREVLGEPEAINIWIGDERSVTSAHRDPYENLYVVLRGRKTFTLWPPVDEICMDAQMVRTGQYVYDTKNPSFSIVMDQNENEEDSSPMMIPWVPIDPQLPRSQIEREHQLYKYARPRTVTVSEGQMLYLPSGWYHHVAQDCGQWDDGTRAPCIAVNYWYDMDYEGEKYATRQLVSRLVQRAQEVPTAKG